MREYLIIISTTEPPAGQTGQWFDYKVLHKPSGTIAPFGIAKATNSAELRKRLTQQINRKLADPVLEPPRNTLTSKLARRYFVTNSGAQKHE